ncbi:hypothetical protein H4R18_000599 [Coemansia javaensis]|uniref:Uncharacterized protein n=1 Tax=Coemansia javaensis TaxID=2761396 RepID=A0A9W8HHH7_9FUNG|nr:hypothetical protein H4R18_000599 [Coemansia javaensis]
MLSERQGANRLSAAGCNRLSAASRNQPSPPARGGPDMAHGGVHFSSKAIVAAMEHEDDMEGSVRTDDIPSLHQLQLTMDDGGTVKRTIICDETVAYEMRPRPSLSDGRQVYQVCARTIEGKGLFPFDQFTSCVVVAATHMAQNVQIHGGDELQRYSRTGFWSPRIKLLYARALIAYRAACEHPHADPSMRDDEIFVTAQVSVRPFSLSLAMCAFPFSSMGTCQVRVCQGTRPESFLGDYQLSNDPLGLTRLITPPISDVIMLNPTTKRLSEGLLSNFFATRYIKPAADRRASADAATLRMQYTSYMLVCAPLESIHRGPMVDEIWGICKRDNIQVSFAGPNLNEAMAGRWSGAFIVNNTYQVLPIDTMHLTDRHNTKVELGACPLVAHLRAEILRMHHNVSMEPM